MESTFKIRVLDHTALVTSKPCSLSIDKIKKRLNAIKSILPYEKIKVNGKYWSEMFKE